MQEDIQIVQETGLYDEKEANERVTSDYSGTTVKISEIAVEELTGFKFE